MKFLLILGLIPFCLAQEKMPKSFGDFLYTTDKEGKSVTIVGYQGNGGPVVVPSKIEGGIVTKIAEKAFSNQTGITKIAIAETVVEIGKQAFSGCFYLKEVILSDRLSTLGEGAFRQCRALTDFYFPLQLTNLPAEVFRGCSSLKTVKIPASVKNIGTYAFTECTSLRSVQISGGVEKIGDQAFSGCVELVEVTLLGRKTGLGNFVFSGCPALNTIQWPSDKPFDGKIPASSSARSSSIIVPQKSDGQAPESLPPSDFLPSEFSGNPQEGGGETKSPINR